MPSKPPRLLPTLALIALWLALYFLWVVVRPNEPAAPTRSGATTTTTTTLEPLFKFKP
jgi:hypothetical protein